MDATIRGAIERLETEEAGGFVCFFFLFLSSVLLIRIGPI